MSTEEKVQEIVDRFLEAIGAGNADGVEDAIRAVIAGTPEEREAAHAITSNLVATLEAAKAGEATLADSKFAIDEARKGLAALAEAKVVRLERKAVDVLIDVVTLFLARI